MTEIQEILLAHLKAYPQMEFDDVYKLLYQHVYGANHAVAEKEAIFSVLKKEAESMGEPSENGFVEIGNGFVRAPIRKDEAYLRALAEKFYLTAKEKTDGDFSAVFVPLRSWILETFSFDEKELDLCFEELQAHSFPPVSHSETYKKLYRPHYRVISKKFL